MKRIAVAALAATALFLSGCAGTASSPRPAVTASADTGRAHVSALTLVSAADAATVSTSTLRMEGADRVTWISERPERQSGSYAVSLLAENWSPYGFEVDAPNALLDGVDANGVPRHLAVELSRPTIDGSELAFQVRFIGGGADTVPMQLVHPVLVIDSTSSQSVSGAELEQLLLQLISATQTHLSSALDNLKSSLSDLPLSGDQIDCVEATQDVLGTLSADQSQLQTLIDPSGSALTTFVLSLGQALETYQQQLTGWSFWRPAFIEFQAAAEDIVSATLSQLASTVR